MRTCHFHFIDYARIVIIENRHIPVHIQKGILVFGGSALILIFFSFFVHLKHATSFCVAHYRVAFCDSYFR